MLSLSAFRQDAGNLKLLHREDHVAGSILHKERKNQVLDHFVFQM